MNFKKTTSNFREQDRFHKHTWLKLNADEVPKVYCERSGVICSHKALPSEERQRIQSQIHERMKAILSVLLPSGPGRFHCDIQTHPYLPDAVAMKVTLKFKHQTWRGIASGKSIDSALELALENCRRITNWSHETLPDDDAAA